MLTVRAPLMVGPTWTRVRLKLGSDCLPALSQGTALLLSRTSWSAYCSHVHDSMIWMIQGCISTLHLSMSPLGAVSSFLFCLLAWCLVSHDGLLCLQLEESIEACIC